MTTPLHADQAGATRGGPPPRRRRWAKTDATQQRILNAATGVFRQHGYSATTIGEVVAAADASIGSIYHHFGGKTELFLAIHEHMAATIEARIAAAEHSVDAQVRAYLEVVWENRLTAVVLSSDDVPPGFERTYREDMRRWFKEWLARLDFDTSAPGRLRARLVVALLTESAAMLMTVDDRTDAEVIVDAALQFLNQLTTA